MTTTKRRMIDPTMTSGLRRAFTADLRRQFSGLKLDIVRYFESDDFQRGLSVDSFSSWLQSRLQERLTGPRQERLWEMLVEESFRRGAGRAYDDVVPRDFSKTKSEWDQGSRAGFVRAIMGSGVQPLQLTGLTTNVFCPTGKGGGVDPTCGTTSSVQDPPVIDLEVYRGGGDKEGELVTYFTTRQDMAESYVDMYNDRYGAGGKLHKKSLSILSPARQDIIFSTALSIGFDEDDITSGTPATIFDQEIHGRDKVKKLVDTLRKSGHDGAILDDIAYGKNIQDKAYIKFSKPEPKNQIPQVRLKKGQRLTALPKDGIRPLGSGMYIYTSGGASYQLKKLGNGKYLVTGARLTTNALPFFSGARRAFDSVKLLAQRAWTEFVGGVQGLANGLARTFLDGRVRDAKPQAVAREMSKQVERARIQSTTVVSDSVVRAFNEGILVAAIPLGVTEIGVAVEWRVRRNPDGSIAKNVCRACRDLEGVVLRPSEAKGLFPRHPRCLPGDSLVSSVSRIAAVSKRWYDGDLVVIETASGRKLSCTPNHPILTDRGWIAAGLLDVGSYVVCDGRSQWKGIIDDNDKDVPTSIHEVSESFRSSRHVVSSEVPLAAPDFHGDGGSSKVAVIWSDSKLRSSGDSPHEKHLLKDHLSIGDVTSQVLSTRLRDLTESLNGSNASSRSCMSCGNLMTSLSRSHFSPSQGKSVAHSADRDVRKSKSSSDRRSINVIANSDRLLRLSGDISVDSVPERVNASSFTPEFSPQEIEDDVERDAQLAREILKGASGPVFLDNVLSVVTKKFSGHVYNLETEKGFYAAEGIITHNCQCSLVAITKAGKDSKTSRGSVVSAIQRSRRRYKSEKAREWASKVKISERRPRLTKNVLVERIDRMLTNVFCPTGEGGGVDPTCSPSFSEGKSLAGEKGIQIKIEGGRIDVQFETKFSPRKHSVIDFVVDEDKRGRGLGDTLLKEALKRYEDLGGQVSSVPSLKLFYKNGFRNPDMSSSSLEEHLKEFRANGGSIYMAHKNEEGSPYTLNVFCPTGKGGGVDPTCSPNGKHIHTETSVLPPEEKSKDEAVIRESYIKDAKDMADSPYTQELVDRVKSRMAMHDERWSETHAQVMKLADKEGSLREKHLKEMSKLDKMTEANLKAKKADKDWPHSEEDINKQAEKCDEALTKYFKHRNAMADKSWDVIRKSVSNEQRRFDGHYSIQEVKIHIDPNINDHIPSTQVVAEVEKVNARLSKCISQEYERRINHLTTVKAIPAGQTLRAHFSGSVHKGPGDHGEIFIGPFDKAGVIAHELGHSLEMDLNTHLAARGFLYHRVGKEVAVPTGSEHWEVGRTDQFGKAFESSASYVGKHYKTPDTEIVSMGLQKMYEEPHFFAKHDPEYFKFMLGVLDGSFR